MVSSMAPRVSVVVPIYNVATYLETCLDSLAQQTMADLEIIMVDDGSTDQSPVIAERFVARDGRFQLLRQANAGQGAARNTGIGQSAGEFLAFVDSDDVLPPNAYEALLGALERTGSDFATGNIRRLTSLGTARATFAANAFARQRLETHITRFPSLTADRLACNKLFRRSFWDRHGFRFPEGVRNEDIPVIMTAHYLAASVDVVAETVYLWRRREGGDLSGSQRRVGVKALRDRVAAVDHVSRFLADRGMTEAKAVYDKSVVGNDLRYFLDVLDNAGEDERHLFIDLANDFLDRADAEVLEQPLAIDRLKWQLVRRRALPELLEVLRFADEELAETPPVREGGQWYGDYPYRTDERLGIPRGVYRLEDELAPVFRLNDVRWEGEALRIEGYAYIDMIGAPQPDSQELELFVRGTGRWARRLKLRTERVYRPDVTADAAQQLVGLDWSGFVATLEGARLRRRRRWREGSWKIDVAIRSGDLLRGTRRPKPAPLHAVPAAELPVQDARVRAGLTANGLFEVRVQHDISLVRSYVVNDNVLRLEGDIGPVTGDEPTLSAKRRDGTAVLDYRIDVDRTADKPTFVARVPIEDFVSDSGVGDRVAHTDNEDDGIVWDFYLVGEGTRRRLLLHEDAPESAWTLSGRELAIGRSRDGNFTVLEHSFRPVVTGIEWSPAGALTLTGSFRGPAGEYEVVIRSRRGGESYSVPLRYDVEAERFTAELNPGSISSLAGIRPLAEGQWEFLVSPPGRARTAAVHATLDDELLDALPVPAKIGHKLFRIGVLGNGLPVLQVDRDLDEDERGGFRQRQLRTVFYGAQRERELRDVVLYDCFGGREYSDNPRGIHEELVRRDAPFEHLWVVRDGGCVPPGTAVALRELSKDYYEAYATARYVVSNDHWPRLVARRPEQTWLQTWHGAPLKRIGHDLAGRPKAVREYRGVLRQPSENWQYVVSPGAFATPILQRAFSANAQVIETGLPRTDVLLRPDRERLAEEVKLRLGLPADKRVVLYAPTYRDHLGARNGYRFGPLLDLAALGSALGDDDVLLFRKHRSMVGALPVEADGFLDVSAFPDSTELLLAVDVLVTDYSSAIFDFASTNRPMVFFTPDLETYRDTIRGFSIDFEADAPGPLLRTTDDVIDALRDLEPVRALFGERYERFVATYCALNDGRAASRVVERVFRW
jgi:CDP-glycerol glycerophosphotransferase